MSGGQTCQECGAPHWIDTSIPSDIWNQIAKPEEMLCTSCIDKRLNAAGLTAQAEFYFVGEALVSRMYDMSYGQVLAMLREESW